MEAWGVIWGFRKRFTGKLFYFPPPANQPSRKINTTQREVEGFNAPSHPPPLPTQLNSDTKALVGVELCNG